MRDVICDADRGDLCDNGTIQRLDASERNATTRDLQLSRISAISVERSMRGASSSSVRPEKFSSDS